MLAGVLAVQPKLVLIVSRDSTLAFGFYNVTHDEISVTHQLTLSCRAEAAEWEPVLKQVKHSLTTNGGDHAIHQTLMFTNCDCPAKWVRSHEACECADARGWRSRFHHPRGWQRRP